jgi:hypothetical protein
VPEVGTYVITDELNQIAPLATNGANHVTDQNFANTGIVFPFNASDEIAALGGADETVTFTFQNDGLSTTTSPATQASLTVAGTVTFQATTPGTAGNNVTIALISGGSGVADSGAVTQSGTNGENISIELLEADGTTVRTWADVINLFSGTNGVSPITVSGAGQITCTAVTSPVNSLTSQASAQAQTALSGGLAAVTQPFANRYLVTTSRTAAQAAADGLGLTGGATTPSSEDQNFVQVGVTTGFTAGGVLPVGTSGFLGQTYIDPVTAFQVTVVDPANALSFGFTQLPSPQYTFAPGDTLTWVVSRENGQITGSKPTIAIPGLQTTVVTTLGCNPGDTAVISTFNRAGTSPAVGEAYFVTFTVAKTAADMAIQTFTNTAAAFAVYGQPDTTANRLSLAINLLNLNGGQQFAAIQVPMQTGLGVASDQSFIDAIQSLATPMSGSGQQPNVIVPLSTSANVQQALSLFLIKQSALGQSGMFAIGFGGFDQFTSTTTMQATAQSIANQRVILNSANSVGIELTAQGSTTAVEFAVTGEFVAAAMAGTYLSPQNDVATDITGQDIIGFTRSLIMFDGPTKNSLAASGITVLNDRNGALEVRDYRTTNPSNILTSKPYVTTTADYISRAITLNLKQFKGRKMTSDLPSSILGVINSMLTSWNSNNSSAIISAYQNVTVVPDSVDPTTIDIALQIRPIFSALFFKVALTVSLSS